MRTWKGLLVGVVMSSAAAAVEKDGGLSAYALMLREPPGNDGGLQVALPPAIPVDSPFELVAWVPHDVADVSALYWRSGKGSCERDDLDLDEEPVLPLKTRLSTVNEGRFDEKRLQVAVPKLSQPWWKHCFRLSFWRRSTGSNQSDGGAYAEPVQLARLASLLDGLDGGPGDVPIIRDAAVTAGLFEGQVCKQQGQWADQLSCERTLNEAAVELKERMSVKRIIDAAAVLRKEITLLNAVDPESPSYAPLVAALFVDTREGEATVERAKTREQERATAVSRAADIAAGRFLGPLSAEDTALIAPEQSLVGARAAFTASMTPYEADAPNPTQKQAATTAAAKMFEEELKVVSARTARSNLEFAAAGEKTIQNIFEAPETSRDCGALKRLALERKKAVFEHALTTATTKATTKFDACDPTSKIKCEPQVIIDDVQLLASKATDNAKALSCIEEQELRARVGAASEALKRALSEAAAAIRLESIHIIRPQAGARGEGAPLHTERAAGFFTTDIGLGALVANFGPADPGALVPVAFVQVAMSLGSVDFDNGIGAVEPPRRTSALKWLRWQLGQRLSLNLGLILNLRPIRSPEGQLTGLFGGSSALGTIGAGFRFTEFLKVNVAVAIATTQPDLPGTGASFRAMPMVGVSLDLPVYRLVGKAFLPVFGPLAELPNPPASAAQGAKP